MRAMLLAAQAAVETSPLVPTDRPVPEPGPGEVRMRVRACGACRTDIHVVEGDLPAMAYTPHRFWEKTLQSVTANTRADGLALLAKAAAIPIRPRVTRYRLEEANRALADIKSSDVEASAVVMIG